MLASYNKTLLQSSFDDGYADAQTRIKHTWTTYIMFTLLGLKALYLVIF